MKAAGATTALGLAVMLFAGCSRLLPGVPGVGDNPFGDTRVTRDGSTLVVEFPNWRVAGQSTAFLCPADPGEISSGPDGIVRVPAGAGCVPVDSVARADGAMIKFSLDSLKPVDLERFDQTATWYVAMDIRSGGTSASGIMSIPGGPIER